MRSKTPTPPPTGPALMVRPTVGALLLSLSGVGCTKAPSDGATAPPDEQSVPAEGEGEGEGDDEGELAPVRPPMPPPVEPVDDEAPE